MKLKPIGYLVGITALTVAACSGMDLSALKNTQTALPSTTRPSTIGTNVKNTHKPARFMLKEPFKGSLVKPFSDSTMGVDISDYQFSVGVDENNDGGEDEHASGTVTVKNKGSHKLQLDGNLFPIMSDKEDTLKITDTNTGNIRTYGADQDFQRYHIHDGNQELLIETNPDGTWKINGKNATTSQEAVRLAMQSPIVANASVHGAAMLYELVKHRKTGLVPIPDELKLPETLTPTPVNSGVMQQVGDVGDPTPLLEEWVRVMENEGPTEPSPATATPEPLTGQVLGRVFTDTQEPLGLFTVTLESEDPKVAFKAQLPPQPQALHAYAFIKVPVGIPLKITVTKEGYQPVSYSNLVVKSEPNPQTGNRSVTFDFGPADSICGTKCAVKKAS